MTENVAIYQHPQAYLLLAALLLAMGIFGLIRRHTLVGMLIAGELVFSAALLNIMALNRFASSDLVAGHVFVLMIMGLAAAEVAIGLSIIIAVYRNYSSIRTRDLDDLSG